MASRKPQLAGMGELLAMLGVSRTRAAQLSSQPDFPTPVAELIMGKVWSVTDIETWAKRRGRALRPLDTRVVDDPSDGA